MYKSIFKFFCLSLLTILYTINANAKLSIKINKGNIDPLPIAIPYPPTSSYDKELAHKIVNLLEKDLESSKLFYSINRKAFIEKNVISSSIPNFIDWQQINASALIATKFGYLQDDIFNSEFRLWDVLSQTQLAGKTYTTHINNWRMVAHTLADQVYERITGDTGYFNSRIVYISETGPQNKRIKRLAIMDQDGANHRYLTDGNNLVLTPRFSPTVQEVIYMSYGKGTPQVYLKNVDNGTTKLVGNFPGMSFAPRFHPNGKSIIMSVSLNGNSEIYSYNLQNGDKKRLTFHPSIDTSASYSPDGEQIVFNSNRGGSQQIYVMDKDGRDVKRISFSKKGRYGTPVWSPRGDKIAFTKMYRNMFYIGIMNIDGTGERLLTKSFLDESPSWSPNGRLIIFARKTPKIHSTEGIWNLHSIDITGYNERKIQTPKDASDPSWSPLL